MDESKKVPCLTWTEFRKDEKIKKLKTNPKVLYQRWCMYRRHLSVPLYVHIGKKNPMNYLEEVEHVRDNAGSYLRVKHKVCIEFCQLYHVMSHLFQ
jgi:hypothetical protein